MSGCFLNAILLLDVIAEHVHLQPRCQPHALLQVVELGAGPTGYVVRPAAIPHRRIVRDYDPRDHTSLHISSHELAQSLNAVDEACIGPRADSRKLIVNHELVAFVLSGCFGHSASYLRGVTSARRKRK